MSILSFIVIICVVAFVHEFGHFIVAKCVGAFVEEFSIGMGPVLIFWLGHEDKNSERTKYSLRLFLIGGYCMIRSQGD